MQNNCQRVPLLHKTYFEALTGLQLRKQLTEGLFSTLKRNMKSNLTYIEDLSFNKP